MHPWGCLAILLTVVASQMGRTIDYFTPLAGCTTPFSTKEASPQEGASKSVPAQLFCLLSVSVVSSAIGFTPRRKPRTVQEPIFGESFPLYQPIAQREVLLCLALGILSESLWLLWGASLMEQKLKAIEDLLVGLLRRHSVTQVQFRYRSTASKYSPKKYAFLVL